MYKCGINLMKISRIKNFFLLSTKIISCFEYWFNTKKEIISLNSQIKNNKKYVLAYKLVLKIFKSHIGSQAWWTQKWPRKFKSHIAVIPDKFYAANLSFEILCTILFLKQNGYNFHLKSLTKIPLQDMGYKNFEL